MLAFAGLPLVLALVAFLVYWPSLKSDFVYDGRFEIIEEGFINSLANLPAVLSLKVLGLHLLLADRPGQILYLMLNAALWGEVPWGFHLTSNLLHAANVALLFILLRRLVAREMGESAGADAWKIQLALLAVTSLFALHPIAVEPVAAINYSSDLLVTFFTLAALLAATCFRPEKPRTAFIAGSVGVFCAFAAVTCKESGLATVILLAAYGFLFRRGEKPGPWLVFIGAAAIITVAFLGARFYCAAPSPDALKYLGGSLAQVFFIQPRLWVFMMGKLVWPTHFSADYTLSNADGLPLELALLILAVVGIAQIWLALRSPLGALGVCTYWAGLLTVSNFVPLFRILADRFYYLPLAGVAMQLMAVYLMLLPLRRGFWVALAPLGVALIPFTFLTLKREAVFANDFALWTDTVRASPDSGTAHNDLGMVLYNLGREDEAHAEWQKALALAPDDCRVYNNLGIASFHQGKVDEAIARYQKALALAPDFAEAHYDLGNALLQKGQPGDAIAEYQKALALRPSLAPAECNLGTALWQTGRRDEAIAHYRQALAIDPAYADARTNLNLILAQNVQLGNTVSQLQAVLQHGAAANTLPAAPSPK